MTFRTRENEGLGPAINRALALINAQNVYYDDPIVPKYSRVADYICYCQDDIGYGPRWLEKLTKMFLLFEQQHKLGFATGIECVEHPVRKRIDNTMVLKDWIRAAMMFGRRDYWMSMWPITRFDPETRGVRARPHDGIGSGVDWHFIRNHPNSVCRTGRTNLVIPGLCVHLGYDRSTWLDRELPESDADKATIAAVR